MHENQFTTAGEQDRAKHVLRPFEDLPLTELVPGSLSHLVATQRLTVSFLTMEPGSIFELHSHENEQLMIVTEGYCDEVIGDKIYRVEKGDVIYLPPNIPHGAFIRDVACKAIDIFAPGRTDYMDKFKAQNKKTAVRFVSTK